MAVNYAEKFSDRVDEAFFLNSLSEGTVNRDFEFTGVETVKVFSIPTTAMTDYTTSGSNRYGTPAELENAVQTMTLTQDRSFTFTIDRKSVDDTMGTMAAGEALARQLRLEVIPEIDIYRFGAQCAAAGTISSPLAIDATNAYSAFLSGTATVGNLKAPIQGRVCVCGYTYYNALKLDNKFVKQSDLSQQIALTGQIGMVDGIPIILVPDSYLPENVAFFITNALATTSPIKLSDYKIHDNPPGINGFLVEGRVRYDAFVLDNKANAIYVHMVA